MKRKLMSWTILWAALSLAKAEEVSIDLTVSNEPVYRFEEIASDRAVSLWMDDTFLSPLHSGDEIVILLSESTLKRWVETGEYPNFSISCSKGAHLPLSVNEYTLKKEGEDEKK